jgi:hypothetical protein
VTSLGSMVPLGYTGLPADPPGLTLDRPMGVANSALVGVKYE